MTLPWRDHFSRVVFFLGLLALVAVAIKGSGESLYVKVRHPNISISGNSPGLSRAPAEAPAPE